MKPLAQRIKRVLHNRVICVGIMLMTAMPSWTDFPIQAQGPPFGVPPPPGVLMPVSPQSQRGSMNNVRARVRWLQNALRSASNYGTGGDQVVWQALHELRVTYRTFTLTLTLQQANYGANELAELDAGIDILEEGIGIYQQDVASGRNSRRSLLDMCQVMREGADFWLQEFNRVCTAIGAGRP